jgi:hypothetical protein
MHLSSDTTECVVFLGNASPSAESASFVPISTGFFIARTRNGLPIEAFLVTAKHCVNGHFRDPFHIRYNTGAETYVQLVENPQWNFHPDTDVDLAMMRWEVPTNTRCRALPDTMILSGTRLERGDIGPGDLTYTVGLFGQLSGKHRNVPLVHTGHLSAVPNDEKIRVHDWDFPKNEDRYREIEAYVVQCPVMPGASGSPVFLRKSIEAADVQHTHDVDHVHGDIKGTRQGDRVPPSGYGALFLLGLWRGSWETGPVQFAGPAIVRNPSGYGIVVPAERIAELLTSFD